MNYPYQCQRTYVNPNGNLAASGYYRTSLTQESANMLPPWMHMRDNPRSIGQQFLSAPALELKRLENSMNDSMRSKFITTAPLDEVDILYRLKLPSNINLTNASASGVRCVAAPSGCSPSGVSQIWVTELSSLKEFYYDCLPTRVEVVSSGDYVTQIDGENWHTTPSGISDLEEKHVDVWKTKHDITWAYNSITSQVMKQDSETLESYESYPRPGVGTITDMDYYDGCLWSINHSGSSHYLTVASTKTKVPNAATLDELVRFDITNGFDLEPSGILISDDGTIWIRDTGKKHAYKVKPRYDYFILDKDNRYIYFREDYRDSGVFVSNT